MADTTYAVLADLLPRLNADGTTSTAYLQSLLNTAAQQVDSLTRGYRPGYEAFSASEAEARLFDDDLSGVVDIDDCLTISQVLRGATAITSPYYQKRPYNSLPVTQLVFRADTTFDPPYLGDGTWYAYPIRGVGLGQFSITGTWGYCTAATRPPAITAATLELAIWAYGLAGLSLADQVVALRDTSFSINNDRIAVPRAVLGKLEPYCKSRSGGFRF
jgi:hypothetical protein